MKYISKRAGIADRLKSLWDKSQGPWENIFRLASYAVPFIPALGWKIFLLEKASSMLFDIGLQDFGRWLDKEQGKGPGSNVTEADAHGAGDLLTKQLLARSSSNEEFKKIAFWGAALRLAAKAIPFVLKYLLLVLGVKYVSDMYESGEMKEKVMDVGESAVNKVKETVTENVPGAGMFLGDGGNMAENLLGGFLGSMSPGQ